MRPRGASAAVSGRFRVEAVELRRKLGDAAWYVLQQLWRVRDPKTGETHVTNAGLASGVAGFVRQSVNVVKKACKRLVAAGLLLFVGRKLRKVKRGRALVEVQVCVRIVRGAPAEQGLGSDALVFVPETTSKWLPAACSWGGARVPVAGGQEYPMAAPGEGGKSTPRSEINKILGKELFDSSPSERNTAAASAAASDPLLGWTPGSDLGLILEAGSGRPKAPVMATSPLEGCPPLPWTLVPFAVSPNPPTLVPEMRDDERAARLVDAFRGALGSRFPGSTDFSFRRGVLSRSKHFPMLVEAAGFMVEREIAPAAWAAWSMDVWKTYTEKRKPPPVAWVFGPKRLAEKRGWFEHEESSYLGGTVLSTPKRTALLRRYLAMRAAVEAAEAWSDPREIVSRFFPDDLFDRLVVEAREEVARVRERVQRRVDAGEFLW